MNWTSFLLFYAAVWLVAGAAVLGIGALEYEVVSEGPVDRVPDGAGSVGYGSLSDRDRATVDEVIGGGRVTFRSSRKLPGRYHERGEVVVRKNGTRYLVDRRLFFNFRTRFAAGSAAVALLAGLVGYAAVRREHL